MPCLVDRMEHHDHLCYLHKEKTLGEYMDLWIYVLLDTGLLGLRIILTTATYENLPIMVAIIDAP